MFRFLGRVLALALSINIALLGSTPPADARMQFNANSGATLSLTERFKVGPIPPALVANAGVNVGLFSLFGPVPGVINYNYFDATDAEAAYLAARGVRYVRIPVVWDIFQSSPGDQLNAGAVASLKRSIATYARYGMLSLVDLHNFNRRTPPGSTTMDGAALAYVGSNAIPVSWFVEFWSKMSAALKGNPGVYGYDLMNEPEQTTAAAWVTQAQAAIDAIRANGDTTPIIVEGVSNGQPDFATANPNIQTLKDPAKRLHFSHHFYPVGAGDNASFNGADAVGSGVTATKLNDRLDPFAAWCASYGFKCNVGEYAVGRDNQLWMAMEDAFLTDAERYQIPSFFYFFGANGAHDENNLYPFDGVEPRQWAVMAKHNGVTGLPVTTRLLASASTAYQSSPVAITLDLRGIVPANATYTLSDGGKGGSFSPATVSMTAGGFNFFPTITYTTPATDQSVTISATNNAGQTNPAFIPLTVSGAAPSGYARPQIGGGNPDWDARFSGTPAYRGAIASLTDLVSGPATIASDGLDLTAGTNSFTSAIQALMKTSGPGTLMIELAQVAGSNQGGRYVNGLIYAGGNSILVQASGGQVQIVNPRDSSLPARIVISWDSSGFDASFGGGDVGSVSGSNGYAPTIFGANDNPQDLSPTTAHFRAAAFRGVRLSASDVQALAAGVTN